MKDNLTIREVSIVTGLHRNTIRNYVKEGRLKAALVGEGRGKQKYIINRDNLYNCGIPRILAHLGVLEVEGRLEKAQAGKPDTLTEEVIGENIRLNRELLAAREELATLRVQIPALQAAQGERDSLRQDVEKLQAERVALDTRLEVTRAAAEQARDNATWRYRRQLKRAGQVK